MIKIRDLTYQVNDKLILNNISLEIEQNKITGIIGKNGSGKTTIIKHLSKEIKSKNSIFIDGKDINNFNVKNYSKKIAFVFQEIDRTKGFTVKEIISLARYPYKKFCSDYTEEDRRKVEKAIEQFSLEKIENRQLAYISGGELKLTLIARALAQDTDIIVLDEPINHLDIDYQIKLMKTLKEIKNKTILMTIHNLELALKYCDNIIILNSGEIQDSGAVEIVINEENIKRAFNVECSITECMGEKIIIYKQK